MGKINYLNIAVIFVILCFCLTGCGNQEQANVQVQEQNSNKLENDKYLYDDNLCLDNEEVVFSFKTVEGNKALSICISEEPSYITYRFGTKENVEFEYPLDKNDSWNSFTYDFYLRGGGAENEGLDLNYLSFENDNFIYRVYDEYDATQNAFFVGVIVINKSTNKETDIKGISKERIGTLATLRDSNVIRGSEDFTGF